MRGVLIGIDLGTTALKVAAFDGETGKVAAAFSQRLPVSTGDDGRREEDPGVVLRALRKALDAVSGITGGLQNVRGIGVAAQGGSTIIAGRCTGKALTPMTLWNDSRALPEFRELTEQYPANYWRKFSLRDEPGMGLARLLRLQAESPELLNEDNIYVGAGEYVYFHLTGVWRQDAGNALQIGCYDARREVLIERAAKLVNANLSFFAPLRCGHETHPLSSNAAKRFGLPAGIPVAGPYMDHEAGYMSVAHVSKRPLQCSLGTAWVGNFQISRQSKARSSFQLVLPSPLGKQRLIVQPLLTGNVTWDWALMQFAGSSHTRAFTKQADIFAEALWPSGGLVCLPWLNRPNPLRPETMGGCCFLGAGPSTRNADFLRAVANGMCFELARVFEEVTTGKIVDSVVLSGGASKGAHFREIIAALFAPLPVYQVEDEDWMGARGVLYPFNAAIAGARVKRLERADMDLDKLHAAQALYRKAFLALYGKVRAGQAFAFTSPRRNQ